MRSRIALVTLHAGYHHSSLALRSIAAACREEAFGPAIRTWEWQLKADRRPMLAQLLAEPPALVGFSTYLWNIGASLELATALKAASPATRIVLGGPEAGPRGEALLDQAAAVDFVIDGEGETAFRDLCRWQLEHRGDPNTISGLVRRDLGGRPRRNPVRPVAVDELPDLARMGVAADRDLVYWETSRGCPFRCSFCTSGTDALRQFPLQRIERDLAVLGGLGRKTVKLLDRSFHLGRRRTVELLERFVDTPAGLRFHLELNPDRISAAAMAVFAAAPAGKFQFEVGLQTLNPEVLARIDRTMDVPLALARLRTLIGLGRHPVHVDLIAGLPGETSKQFGESLDRTFALYPGHLQLGILKLLPGTPLLAQAGRLGYRWQDAAPYTVIHSDAMDAAALRAQAESAELIERLWNSGWLCASLRRLVEQHFDGSLSALLGRLRAAPAAPVLLGRAAAPAVFQALATEFESALDADPTLHQSLLWDYARLQRPGGDTPAAIRRRWRVERGRPVLELGAEAAALVAQRGPRLGPGTYRVHLRHHLKGRPLDVEPVSGPGY